MERQHRHKDLSGIIKSLQKFKGLPTPEKRKERKRLIDEIVESIEGEEEKEVFLKQLAAKIRKTIVEKKTGNKHGGKRIYKTLRKRNGVRYTRVKK
jgi:hypothetical protein